MPVSEAELSALFDAHVAAEFVAKDIDATMATMTDAPHVTHVPVMTGGHGREAMRSFYETWFIGHWPADVSMTPIARTIGQGRVVDEFVLSFTHDVEMPAMFPGVAPTGRSVSLPTVVVMGMAGDRIEYERIYWDQASALAQLGLIDEATLPVAGATQAARLLDPTLPSNTLIERSRRRPDRL